MKYILLFLSTLLLQQPLQAQVDLNSVINTVNSALGNGLSNKEITDGLRQALEIGSKNAGTKASKTDGYYKNNLIKIPFPSDARDMRKTLMNLGMKKQVEAFERQLNRAAEDAAKKAAPIFVAAISKMTINDGLTILRGKNDEATQFLKRNSREQLVQAFRPVIGASLKKVEITKYWNPLFTRYNKLPMVKKVNPKLDDYVTQKAIEGLFKLVAEEETKIRKDPAARITELLKKVFG